MKTIININLTLALLVAPAFAGNDKNYTYLALGDSIPFGMNPLLLPPYAQNLPNVDLFVGYPETVAAAEHLLQSKKEVNASCPGETSGSFLKTSSPDFGCNSPHMNPWAPPFKTIGLHTNYSVAQMDFAKTQFQSNKHINLVTLSIGANDILLVLPALEQCGANTECANGVLTPVLSAYEANLTTILADIRAEYQGTLVLLTYYSPLPALDGVTMALNGVMTKVAAQFSKQPVLIADGFSAFQTMSAPYNDDACQAGLLIRLPSPIAPGAPPCDIHPSTMGRDLLAATVELAIRTTH
jgi:hypothetical protein